MESLKGTAKWSSRDLQVSLSHHSVSGSPQGPSSIIQGRISSFERDGNRKRSLGERGSPRTHKTVLKRIRILTNVCYKVLRFCRVPRIPHSHKESAIQFAGIPLYRFLYQQISDPCVSAVIWGRIPSQNLRLQPEG